MAWNSGRTKTLEMVAQQKDLAWARPNSRNTGSGLRLSTGGPMRPYREGWDVERAMREAYQRVTWVYRCVDAIASSQAGLTWTMRTGDPDRGEIIKGHPVSRVLNSRANIMEDAWAFRYRLSGQVLLSPRGAFVEKVYSNGGELLALQLLPPQYTEPVPDEVLGIKAFKIKIPGMDEPEYLDTDKVLWIRKPHILDPYGASTALEALGVAVDMDWIARVYNRNFLANDGRPGGLVVVKGALEKSDREELQARFRGNISTAGRVSVIGSEGGADFVDTAITPRDAQYSELRNLTKDEILVGFGVDEAILGNASARTLENVNVAKEIYWEGTVLDHCGLISRPFDALDEDENVFSGFDFTRVSVLQRVKAEREKMHMEQYAAGVTSLNEFRLSTGRLPVVGGDYIYAETAGRQRVAIAQTENPLPGAFEPIFMTDPRVTQIAQAAAAAGGAKEVVVVHNHYDTAREPLSIEAAKSTESETTSVEDSPALIEHKAMVTAAYTRWEKVFGDTMRRFFERQEKVVVAKIDSAKTRQRMANGTKMSGGDVFDSGTWNRQLSEDGAPVLSDITDEYAKMVVAKSGAVLNTEAAEFIAAKQSAMATLLKVNNTTFDALSATLIEGQAAGETPGELATRAREIFGDATSRRVDLIASTQITNSANQGLLLAAKQVGGVTTKTWTAIGDGRTRPTHREADGQQVLLAEKFMVGSTEMDHPGDALGGSEAMACRCSLFFGFGDATDYGATSTPEDIAASTEIGGSGDAG